jgi:hypothetical protein
MNGEATVSGRGEGTVEGLELIRLVHEVDRALGEIGSGVRQRALSEQVEGVRVTWRGLAFAVTADLCGTESPAPTEMPRRRRRKRGASDVVPSAEAPNYAGSVPGGTTR